MKLSAIARELGLECLTPELGWRDAGEVGRGYVSDLLSDVIAHAPKGGVLVTVQTHLNVVAVAAAYAELSAVVFALDRRPEETVRSKAVEEKLPLFVSPLPAFEIVGRLYALGIRGSDE